MFTLSIDPSSIHTHHPPTHRHTHHPPIHMYTHTSSTHTHTHHPPTHTHTHHPPMHTQTHTSPTHTHTRIHTPHSPTHTHSCPLSPAVSKASSGAMELAPVYSVYNVGEFLSEADQTGWKILGTCSSNPEDEDAKEDTNDVPMLDCSQYTVKEPTIIALGERV